jgi:hypothetical protein
MSNPNANAGIPSFLDDPASCLTAIAARPPSRDLWGMLSGAAASSVKEDEHANLRPLYLRAVAQQLPASEMAAAEAAATNNSNTMEFEMIRAQRLLEVLEVSFFSNGPEINSYFGFKRAVSLMGLFLLFVSWILVAAGC